MSKKIFLSFIFVIPIFCMVACAGNENPSQERQKLSADEICWFEEEFFNQNIPYNMENMFLTCEYSDVQDIDLSSIFYNGTESGSTITDDERDFFLKKSGADPNYEIFKSTAKQMNEILEKYAGISLSEFRDTRLSSFTYIKDSDAYFISHTDTNYFICEITDGEWIETGECILTYHDKNRDESDSYIVKLKEIDKNNGVYHFISNERVEKN